MRVPERRTQEKDTGEPAFSPDGRYLYFSDDARRLVVMMKTNMDYDSLRAAGSAIGSAAVIVLSTQPARIADDFAILEPRPRSAAWQRSTEAVKMEERILDQLHRTSAGRGEVTVSV